MHIDRIPVYRAYQRTVDLDLYHAFAELVVQTSQDDTAGRTYRQMRTMQIWQPESDVFGYFEPYNLRYPGEVLERFEEKLGDDVRVLRALALALGNTCAIQSDNMFVGNQRGTFLQKVRRSAREDVYLQGALYLLETDTTQRHSLLDELAAKVYVRTEEALFVLSLFDDVEYGYRAIRYPVSEMQESLWKKNLSLARGAFGAEEVDDFYHTLRLGELPHSTCLSYRTGSQRECLLAAFDSNKKIVLVKKDEAVVARACLRLTKGAFQKPPAVDFSFADLSQENTEVGKSAADEKAVLFLESIYTFGLNDVEKEEVMKLAVSLTTQKAAELGVVAVLARRYLGCYERDEYVLAPFYVYISKSKNGWQYLDSLGGAAYTSAKEEYVERPFLVMQTAMHQAEVNSRNEVEYE